MSPGKLSVNLEVQNDQLNFLKMFRKSVWSCQKYWRDEDLDFAQWHLHAGWKPPREPNWHHTCILSWNIDSTIKRIIHFCLQKISVMEITSWINVPNTFEIHNDLVCHSCASSLWVSDILGHYNPTCVCVTKSLSPDLDVSNVIKPLKPAKLVLLSNLFLSHSILL